MTTMYKTTGCASQIEAVEIVKQTAYFVTYKYEFHTGGGVHLIKTAKRSSYENYFDTREEAKAFLVKKVAAKLNSKRHEVTTLETLKKEIEAL